MEKREAHTEKQCNKELEKHICVDCSCDDCTENICRYKEGRCQGCNDCGNDSIFCLRFNPDGIETSYYYGIFGELPR